jgi:hypothetical protein
MSFDRFVASVHLALLLLCCAFVGVATWSAWHLYRHAELLIENADRAAIVVGGAATDLQKTLAIERRAAQYQIDQAAVAESAIGNSADALDKLVRHTDRSLNDAKTGLLPALASVPPQILSPLQTLAGRAGDLIADARTTNGELGVSIQNFDTITAQLATALPPVLKDVQTASDNVRDISSTSKQTSAQIEGTAEDFHAFVHRETTPARGAWNTFKTTLRWLVEPGAAVATAAK